MNHMANDVNRLIDMLYERIEDAKAPPLKPHLSMVDRDELLDMLDDTEDVQNVWHNWQQD
mgnify:CR=1 FL=1